MDRHVAPTGTWLPEKLLFGVAYYPEYLCTSVDQIADRVKLDLDLMRNAGINVIRVGESVWSTWEPWDGHFELDWLEPVLNGAGSRGIDVIIGTPTYAVPPWLQVAHPEIAAQRRGGQRVPWGARQEVDYSHPTFRRYAERVIRAVVGRYVAHPAVIGFQVDNEPGLELFYNDHVFESFVAYLKRRYGDVETLNREWGLTYWSHRLTDFSELWRPDGNTFPQYDLAWRHFQADLTTDFIGWQARIVGEYRRPEQFITTCLQYPRRGIAEERLGEVLDVAAGNPYYGMQDYLDAGIDLPAPNYWTTTGVAGLFRQADRIFATKQGRFLVTETNALTISGPNFNCPPYPGQLKQAAFAFISRGAAMIEYWHWHSIPFGAETFWGGVLPHSLKPGRIYAEISALGADLAKVRPLLDGYQPDADVALLWSTPSRYALQFMPPLNDAQVADEESYEKIFDSFYRGAIEAGRQPRILHVSQAEEWGAEALVRDFPALICAAAYVISDAQIRLLQDYAALGGHLVLGPRTAYADTEARARVTAQPAGLSETAGVWYEEFTNLDQSVPVDAAQGNKLLLPSSAAANKWIECLIPSGAEVLASYRHPRFGDFAAVTTRHHGQGRVTVVGCLPSPDLAKAVVGWASPVVHEAPFDGLSSPIVATSGHTSSGRQVWFVFNWSWTFHELTITRHLKDITSEMDLYEGQQLSLGPWAAVALVQT